MFRRALRDANEPGGVVFGIEAAMVSLFGILEGAKASRRQKRENKKKQAA